MRRRAWRWWSWLLKFIFLCAGYAKVPRLSIQYRRKVRPHYGLQLHSLQGVKCASVVKYWLLYSFLKSWQFLSREQLLREFWLAFSFSGWYLYRIWYIDGVLIYCTSYWESILVTLDNLCVKQHSTKLWWHSGDSDILVNFV